MTLLLWDQVSERLYETGVDKGVLYIPTAGVYDVGYAWNGLTTVTESPSGAEATAQYADNMKYLNLISAEDFGGTIEALMYPSQFALCDGTAFPSAGISVGQQARRSFGLAYRTRLGNDTLGTDYAYKLHLVYGATAAPSEKAFASINDSPEAMTFSWAFTTIPVPVTDLKPSAILVIDSSKVPSAGLTALENALYGTAGTTPRLPLPDEVISLLSGGAPTVVTTTAPTFVSTTGVITIPTVSGVTYRRSDTNAIVTGTTTIAGISGAFLTIKATPTNGTFVFSPQSDDDWTYVRTA